MPFAHITGWGMYVPEPVLTNDDIAKLVDTNDEWIRDRTGIPLHARRGGFHQGFAGGQSCAHRVGFDNLRLLLA